MGRRAFSGLLVGAGTLFIEEIVRRGFFVPETPVKPEVLSANEQVVKAATKVIDLCKQRGQTSDVFHLVRNLIPVDAKAAYEYIKDLPVEQKSWLAADLAQYDPANAEKIMVTYEQSHDYTSAARIAIALSYYCKEHLSDASSKYVSGVPVDPVKKAAYTAAVRVANTCNDADIQDMIDIAGSISYRYSNFGKPVDKAQQKVEALRTAGKHDFVEMFCRVIARDNSSTVADCIRYYQDQITKRTGDQQAKMLQMARDLAIDIAPFSPETAVATMQAFDTQKASSDFSAAADAIAVAVAPYELSAVSKYIVEDAFTHKNRMPLGIAIVRRMPGMYHTLRGEMTGPYLPWYEFAYDPTSEKAQKALDALNDANFKNSAYWATVTALKSQTSEQK